MSSHRPAAALVLLGLALEGAFAAMASLPGERSGVLGTVMLQFAAGLLFLAALAVTVRWPGAAPRFLVLGFAVLFRATLVLAPPCLSTDLWRYAWEGRVVRAGLSPYALAPDAPELAPLRDAAWERVEHRAVPAVYGPLCELAFAAAPAPRALKALHALADLGIVLLLRRALVRRGKPASLALAWAWHPLPIVEVAGQGHLDAVPVALLLVAIDAAETSRGERLRSLLAGLGLGLSAAAKYLPLALVPALARRHGARAVLAFALAFVAPWAALALATGGPSLPRGLGTYAPEWSFNATGHAAIDGALESTGAGPALAHALARATGHEGERDSWRFRQAPSRAVAAALVVLVALVAARRRWPLEEAAFAVIGTVLLVSPVVHPWYLLWVLPFAVVRGQAWLLELTLSVPLVYEVLLRYDGTPATWDERAWPRLLWLGPPAALAALGLRRARAG